MSLVSVVVVSGKHFVLVPFCFNLANIDAVWNLGKSHLNSKCYSIIYNDVIDITV